MNKERELTFGIHRLASDEVARIENCKIDEVKSKIAVRLIGENGNMFNLMGIATKALREHGQIFDAKKMVERVTSCGSYDEALLIIGEYVEIH